MSSVLRQNIKALADLRRLAERERTPSERIADGITTFSGSMRSVVLHALLFGSWIIVNVGMIPGLTPFDPLPFVMLAMFASVEAIFLSTFVLISQNRGAALANRRSELDVQISLLAEHEITRLIGMVDALLQHFQVQVTSREEMEALEKDVSAETVVRAIEEAEQSRDE